MIVRPRRDGGRSGAPVNSLRRENEYAILSANVGPVALRATTRCWWPPTAAAAR